MAVLIGLEQFEKQLKDLAQEMRGQVLREATLKSVQPLVQKAAAIAPRGSGALGRSMTAQSMGYAHPAEAIVRVGPGYPAGSHGILLEFGTIHMTPRPFLALAYAATHQEIINEMEHQLFGLLK